MKRMLLPICPVIATSPATLAARPTISAIGQVSCSDPFNYQVNQISEMSSNERITQVNLFDGFRNSLCKAGG
ncbi:hypothetical protein BKA61DRAFT_601921 [Leptodontidium sp. MPI-SDFR-AT-0119]|nr:hypothetical protein BKA61DRAFT_601921 [Leptodontidium sp. MPI-SDFR-AT-0119]